MKFNPLIFLMALGAGGIAIIPFAFLQYTTDHGPGLVVMGDLGLNALNVMLYLVMIVFSVIHVILSVIFLRQLAGWLKTADYKNQLLDPLTNASILAPFISIIMTMNVFIGPVRFFIPVFSANLQMFMLPAFIVWALLWAALLRMVMRLLRISFEKSFDVNKISFGWLLYPFALGMLTVTGTGIAALARTAWIAHTAAFMSFVSGTMGLFLLVVKLIAIFQSHFAQVGLPEKQFLPSFLIVVPNITLYAISAFRIGHYLEHFFGFSMGPYYLFVIGLAFAFETWYLAFGIALLAGRLKEILAGEFFVSQWGFICPVVAYAVLGSFLYSVFIPSTVIYATVLVAAFGAILLFVSLWIRQNGIARSAVMPQVA